MCRHPFELTPRQLRIFGKFPDPGRPVPPVLFCCRQTDHPGPHIADGVESLHVEVARWLRWGRHAWRIFDADYCGPRSDRVEFALAELDCCYLPRSHRGSHTSEYFPIDMLWPNPERFVPADDWHQRSPGEDG